MSPEIKEYINSLPHAGEMVLSIYDYFKLGYRVCVISKIEVKPIGMGIVRWLNEGADLQSEAGARVLEKYLNYPDRKRKKRDYSRISPNSYIITCTLFNGIESKTFDFTQALQKFEIMSCSKTPATATMIDYFKYADSIGARWIIEDFIFNKKKTV